MYGPGNSPCSNLFTYEVVANYRDLCHEMERSQLDMLILGQLAAHRRVPKLANSYNEIRVMVKKKRLEGDALRHFIENFRPSNKYFHGDKGLKCIFCLFVFISDVESFIQSHIF